MGVKKSYLGDKKSYIGDQKSYVGVKMSYVGNNMAELFSQLGTRTLPNISVSKYCWIISGGFMTKIARFEMGLIVLCRYLMCTIR